MTNARSAVTISDATRTAREARPFAITRPLGAVALWSLSLASGCTLAAAAPAEADRSSGEVAVVRATPTDDVAPQGLSQNGLSQNGLSGNGLSQNGLSQNGLSQNGLGSAALASFALTSNASFASWFEADRALGSEVMTYVTRCAVEAGGSLSYVAANGVGYAWQGSLGLAPRWRSAPIAPDEQELVSACLMAHVNGAGRHVEISVRGVAAPLVASTTKAEAQRFRYREGAFYGNVFTANGLHVCSANASMQERLYGSTGRVCTLPGNCGFQWDGDCDDVCTTRAFVVADASSESSDKPVAYGVYDRCGARSNIVTTFLTP